MIGGRRDGEGANMAAPFSRRDTPRNAERIGGRRALLDGAKGASATAVPLGPRARVLGKGRVEKDADDGRVWRRMDDAAPRAAGGMPAWMAEDATTARPVGGAETIEAFKARMREMERRERGEPTVDEPRAPQANSTTHVEEPETESETTSRFARFFDNKNDGKASNSATGSPQIGSLDLFGMFQTMQKREKTTDARGTPGTPTAPPAAVASPARQPQARPIQSPSPRAPPPQAPPPQAPAPQVRPPTAAPAPTDTPVDGLPKPSAADMASMQMLMAKLMGRPAPAPAQAPAPAPAPESRGPIAAPSAPPGLGARPPVPPMGMYARPMPAPPHASAQPNVPLSQMDFLHSLLRTSAQGGAPPPPPPPGLYPTQPPSWPQGPPYAGVPLPPGIPMPLGAPPGLGERPGAHGTASWHPSAGRPT